MAVVVCALTERPTAACVVIGLQLHDGVGRGGAVDVDPRTCMRKAGCVLSRHMFLLSSLSLKCNGLYVNLLNQRFFFDGGEELSRKPFGGIYSTRA